ncbi:MAG: YARHG domain-containing protein [Muribaculaceae bacterium]|nr:YARHG domain-containing protein [Muribaculaceae bacterium]
MIRNLTFLIMVTIALGLSAQRPEFNGDGLDDTDCQYLADTAASHIAAHMKVRKATTRVLPITKYLTNSKHTWTDGVYTFYTDYDDEGYISLGGLPFSADLDLFDFIGPLSVKKGKILVEDKPQARVNVEKIGDFVMLVERDQAGIPVRAFHSVSEEYERNYYMVLLFNYMLAGHYTAPDSSDVIFGPKMPFYSGYKYAKDPGICSFFYDFNSGDLLISYGWKRVSRGNPDLKKDERMPGEGGAGALMNPMVWKIVPTVAGLDVKIIHDEPFVDHNPRIGGYGDEVSLTYVESPFKDMPGHWAFASVIPLTHTLLKMFPKEVLTLMRGEIYARHGDTFKDPDTQRYFDAQPWYKKSGQAVKLTDVERYNYQLIKQVEQSK